MSQTFILVIGPSAVGKATISRELAKQLDFIHSHGHMSIKYVRNFIDWGDEGFWKFVGNIRRTTYRFFARSEIVGFIDTFVWNFENPSETEWVKEMSTYFTDLQWKVRVVELQANLDTRLVRNVQPDRIKEKPSKENIEVSTNIVRKEVENGRRESQPGQWFPGPHFKIDTSELTVVESVKEIISWLASLA